MVWVHSLMLAFTLAAVVCDIVRHRIYNALVYPGIVVAILANTLIPEARGWQDSLLGFGLCGGAMFVAFAFFDIGGGDVKLLAMMGAFLGLSQGIEAMLWTLVIGMVLGLAVLIWRYGIAELLTRTVRHLVITLRYRQVVPLEESERAMLKYRLWLAPSAFLAELIVVFGLMDRMG
jgi:prepilin peptidase CpaA